MSVSTLLGWMFVLMAALIALVYFKGTVADINAIGANGVNLSYALTGRNAQGNFAAYPTGA